MEIASGLLVALAGAAAIACGVLGLSSVYLGQFQVGLLLLAGTLTLGLGAASGWRWFFRRLPPELSVDTPGGASTPAPRAPVLIAGAWLVLLSVVLACGAGFATGQNRWLSAGGALVLAAVGITVVAQRRAE